MSKPTYEELEKRVKEPENADAVRKKAEEALKKSEAKFRNIYNTSPIGYHSVDVNGYILNMNKTELGWLGYKKEEIIEKKTIFDLQTEESAKRGKAFFKQLKKKGRVKDLELEMKRKDGTSFPVILNALVLFDENGKFIMSNSTVIDITERKKREQNLKTERDKLKTLMDGLSQTGIGIDIVGIDYIVYFQNQVLKEKFGDITKELCYEKYMGLNEPCDFCPMIKALKNNKIESVELIADDGRNYEIISAPLQNPDGIVDKAIEVVRDISERKKAEEKLKESQKRLLFHTEHSPLAVVEWDSNFIVTRWTGEAEKMFGWSPKETIGKPIMDLNMIYEEDIPNVEKVMKRLTDGETQHVVSSNRNYTKDRQVIYCEWYNSVLYNEQREMVSVMSQVLNVTERKKAEEALILSEKRYKTLFQKTQDGRMINDTNGKIIDVNKSFADMHGYTIEELKKMSLHDLDSPEFAKKIPERMKRILKGEYLIFDAEHYHKDGHIFPLQVSANLIEIKDKKYIVTSHIDLTEKRRLEEQLQIRQRMDSLGTLAGGIAHDFNNLLASIMGNLDMLSSIYGKGLNQKQINCVNNAMKSSERAASLIGQFQTLSRGSVVGKVSVDVYETADDVFGVLKQTTDRLIEKKIAFNKGNFYVTANPSELNQVLMNLSMNSVHAIEEKGVKKGDYVSIRAEDYSITGTDITGLPEGEYVHILFEDSGTGMTDEVKRKAFDPLFTTKDKGTQKGQGLGLAMVYNIVTRNHGGHITIESSVGKGTTFHIYLPKAHSEARAIPEEIMGAAGGDETVLIIEDEGTILKLVRSILEKFSYTVLTAEDGEKGLDIYKKKKDSIDLVILDLTMPEMSGQMVFEEMLKIDPKVKVIISSGHSEEDICKGIFSLAQGYVKKPYKIKKLTQAVRTVLDT